MTRRFLSSGSDMPVVSSKCGQRNHADRMFGSWWPIQGHGLFNEHVPLGLGVSHWATLPSAAYALVGDIWDVGTLGIRWVLEKAVVSRRLFLPVVLQLPCLHNIEEVLQLSHSLASLVEPHVYM